jgi:hypothetical protein
VNKWGGNKMMYGNSFGTKFYPVSKEIMINLEFIKNYTFNRDMTDDYNKCIDILSSIVYYNNSIPHLAGKEYGKAKEYSMNANVIRNEMNSGIRK